MAVNGPVEAGALDVGVTLPEPLGDTPCPPQATRTRLSALIREKSLHLRIR
jgi:hypothetical protein